FFFSQDGLLHGCRNLMQVQVVAPDSWLGSHILDAGDIVYFLLNAYAWALHAAFGCRLRL
ncbi:hypothetical protein, partial [Pseudomonas sp. IT-P258]|uniref:hypothetical protein n=1 Tax=Pseudomonas sp. IT-P258 TaxID=3026447 RepID=UPI0039E1BCD0